MPKTQVLRPKTSVLSHRSKLARLATRLCQAIVHDAGLAVEKPGTVEALAICRTNERRAERLQQVEFLRYCLGGGFAAGLRHRPVSIVNEEFPQGRFVLC